MENNDRTNNKNYKERRTPSGSVVKVRLKRLCDFCSFSCVLVFLSTIFLSVCICPVQCNRPPRFLIDGQTEIVLRLKEGPETPEGNNIIILQYYRNL